MFVLENQDLEKMKSKKEHVGDLPLGLAYRPRNKEARSGCCEERNKQNDESLCLHLPNFVEERSFPSLRQSEKSRKVDAFVDI
jgi:hypothetical protein